MAQIEREMNMVEQYLVDAVKELVLRSPNKWSPGDLARYLGCTIRDIFDILNEKEHLKKYVIYKHKEGGSSE